MNRDAFRRGAAAALIALILLTLAWELWLAPLRPGGSFLAFKALLLLLPLRGILVGRLYTYQWSSMFILAFFSEGVMRGWADSGLARQIALGEILLSTLFFICVLGFARSFKRRV
ncbi:DUF2069 domain-containing protein [Chromobacterium sphagni]|uniref:DUF2069 domain-containing protein n=1 Tax=Chromobacterium sphagni TaxID=1903179 RepID=A0A1S1WZC4_9NEIS|nr:DUF2069 domain-containing protein [Chromobacterium sphagni]OHX12499.1 hypothetical protein BI347_02520 [Chromobacterium sphagni]OHX21416.1 hypothetical protein BI344_02480 [Chromobacterium sphagni]